MPPKLTCLLFMVPFRRLLRKRLVREDTEELPVEETVRELVLLDFYYYNLWLVPFLHLLPSSLLCSFACVCLWVCLMCGCVFVRVFCTLLPSPF